MQPIFLPWQGYFGLVAAADVFVVLDDFQFQRHSFQQRNRVRLADGTETWITLPVAHLRDGQFPTLAQAAPLVDGKWRRRLKTTLDQGYGRSSHHTALRAPIDAWIDTSWTSVADMNLAFVQLVEQRQPELAPAVVRREVAVDVLVAELAGPQRLEPAGFARLGVGGSHTSLSADPTADGESWRAPASP